MCVYCMFGDHAFEWNPPWRPSDTPAWPWHIPTPKIPAPEITPWPVDRLREFEELLRRVKELEDKLGCPCEPNKADYLALIRERIEILERRVAGESG